LHACSNGPAVSLKRDMRSESRLGASFRDPSGFVFKREGELFRQVNLVYRDDYDLLMDTGLYQELASSGMLVSHQEVNIPAADPELAYKVLRPDPVSFISYPYEWCFSQLKDAALLTLEIQKRALARGMRLKDASAYNIQFRGSKPVLIDTLSFEAYREGEPWTAYRQFCQHFLAPLALAAVRDVRLAQLLRVQLDGIPLDLSAGLLPSTTRLNFGLLTHIHAHAAAQKRYAGKATGGSEAAGKMSRVGLMGLVDSLEATVRKLNWKPSQTAWAGYYTDNNYSSRALASKQMLVENFLDQAAPKTVWDLGANVGLFSRLASRRGAETIAFDVDPGAVELNYLDGKKAGERNLLPLLIDLTNPSPALGWQNQERMSFFERGPVDAILALALIHHLAISNNTPLGDLAAFFARITRWLLIEFVPKEDSQVKRLLASRQDIFPDYHVEGFEVAFGAHFTIHSSHPIEDSQRCLYVMENRSAPGSQA
jgi:ribosomal protein L11 methylase PrmA